METGKENAQLFKFQLRYVGHKRKKWKKDPNIYEYVDSGLQVGWNDQVCIASHGLYFSHETLVKANVV